MSIGRQIAFLAVILGITGGLHTYIWLRLIRDAQWPSPWNRIGTGVVFGLWVLMLLSFLVIGPRASLETLSPFAWITCTWLGVIAILMAFLLPADAARLLAWVARKFTGSEGLDPERRVALARGFSAVVGVGTTALSAYALRKGLETVTTQRIPVSLKRLTPGLEGFRIVQLTDVHVGPMIGRDFIEQLVASSNALSPDVVAITGDLVDGSVAELGAMVEPLKNLKARHGVFFVTGNHEYYSGVEEWLVFLKSLGIRVLQNERVRIDHDGSPIDLAGVDDFMHDGDVKRALAGRDPAIPVVLLAHQPKHAEEAASLGADLQLSGHTHGGQIFPFSLLVHLDTPYVKGLHTVGGMQLYVSSGTGYWGPPMRLGTQAEITEVVLTGSAASRPVSTAD